MSGFELSFVCAQNSTWSNVVLSGFPCHPNLTCQGLPSPDYTKWKETSNPVVHRPVYLAPVRRVASFQHMANPVLEREAFAIAESSMGKHLQGLYILTLVLSLFEITPTLAAEAPSFRQPNTCLQVPLAED